MFTEEKVFIIAEMAQTYEGSFDIASKLVQAAISAKADAIKFQCFLADELARPDYQYYELYKKLELSPLQWGKLIDQAHAGGIAAFSDVFGIETAKMLMGRGIDGFKIHPTDIKNPPLLKFLAATGKPLLLTVGGSHKEEIANAINILQSNGAGELVIMHGFQSYPTFVEHTNLSKMILYRDTFGLPVGFADHIDGDHELRFALPAFAMGMGARAIEKHITMDRSLMMEDYQSSLSPSDFIVFVRQIRALEAALGQKMFDLTEPELVYRKGTKKHIVAARDLCAGQVIGEDDLYMKRTPESYEFQDRDDLVGKKLRQDVKKDELIKLEFLS